VVLTIESSNNPLQKIIIRNSKCDIRVFITKNSHSKIIKSLCKEYPSMLKEVSLYIYIYTMKLDILFKQVISEFYNKSKRRTTIIMD